jgi:hypothetical protein
MTQGSRRQAKDLEPLDATETQTRLHDALKLLFELLEKYSPVWYEKHYHDQAQCSAQAQIEALKPKLTVGLVGRANLRRTSLPKVWIVQFGSELTKI